MSTKCEHCGQTVEDGKTCTTMACLGKQSNELPTDDFKYKHPEE
jgi:hypothetical protein